MPKQQSVDADEAGHEATTGEVVRKWREYRGWSPTELATRAQVPQPYLSQLEHDKILRPREPVLRRLAIGLEIPMADLLTRKPPPTNVLGNRATPARQTRGRVEHPSARRAIEPAPAEPTA